MKVLRKYKVAFLFFVLFTGCILSWYVYKFNENVLIAICGGLVSLYFGISKVNLENDQLFKELFEKFNSRYDERLNNLINELSNDSTKELDKDERNLIIDYFNLCAEEYFWYKRNRLYSDVWIAWKSAILVNLEIRQIKAVYLKETETKEKRTSFYGLCEELNIKKDGK